jgi:hypothetical protein
MNSPEKNNSRKKFLRWGVVTAASATFLKFFLSKKEAAKGPEKIKMLTEDGVLVEIDASHLGMLSPKKITTEELKGWVKKK